MKGEAIPLVMIPRFTSYVGPGQYPTAPLQVSAYSKANLTLSRGPLIGAAWPYSRTFSAKFQGSHDAQQWVDLVSPVTTANAASNHEIELTRRWLRILIELTTGDDPTSNDVGITCWSTGLFERRLTDGKA